MIELIDVYKAYGKGEARVEALRGVNLTVAQGEKLAIMGKSGCGKSTLLNILGALLSMDRGEYLFNGARQKSDTQSLTRFRRETVGFVMQYFALVDDLTVEKNIALPLRYQGIKGREIRERTHGAMEAMGILDKRKKTPDQLSGGQKQRVAIARALVKKPALLLADEPTGALDEETGREVLCAFDQLNEKGMTIVLVTHDAAVAKHCDRVLQMQDGRFL